jgi:hypothetical protein
MQKFEWQYMYFSQIVNIMNHSFDIPDTHNPRAMSQM